MFSKQLTNDQTTVTQTSNNGKQSAKISANVDSFNHSNQTLQTNIQTLSQIDGHLDARCRHVSDHAAYHLFQCDVSAYQQTDFTDDLNDEKELRNAKKIAFNNLNKYKTKKKSYRAFNNLKQLTNTILRL